jgi:hypothetical protein
VRTSNNSGRGDCEHGSLGRFPNRWHALEDFALENEVAGVVALGEKVVFVERLRVYGVSEDVVLHVLQREITFGNGGEAVHPVGNGQLVGGGLLLHQAPPKGNPKKGRITRNYSAV